MTIEQMHQGINIRLQKLDSGAYDDVLPEELDYYINQSIVEFVNGQAVALQFPEGNEQINKVQDSLRTLVTEASIAEASPANSTDKFTFTIPADYNWYIFSSISIPAEDLVKINQYVHGATLKSFLENHHNSPLYRKLPIYTVGNTFKVLTDKQLGDVSSKVATLELVYIKTPVQVNINTSTDSDLPVQVHEDIVNLAVSKIITDITPRQ